MNYRTLRNLVMSISLSAISLNAIAAASQQEQDEATVVGACMVQKFMTRKPPIPHAKIEKCADAVANMVPKCLGISETEYTNIIKVCIGKLAESKCMADKMKVPLMQYATCDYERDPNACYKKLGFTPNQVSKLHAECRKQ